MSVTPVARIPYLDDKRRRAREEMIRIWKEAKEKDGDHPGTRPTSKANS